MLGENMSKVKATQKVSDTPETIAGRVIGKLEEIEAWFRDGYKTKQVLERLNADGILVQDSHLRRILRSFGKGERAVRRVIAGVLLNGVGRIAVVESVPPLVTPEVDKTKLAKKAGTKTPEPVKGQVARDLQEKLTSRRKPYVERVRNEEDIV